MAAKDIVSGVGARYGVFFLLDSNGLPLPSAAAATPYTGVEIEGIKTTSATDPEPQRITHYGNDRPFAQDSLAPMEVESATFTTAKTNLTLDATIEGNIVRTYGSELQVRAANSDDRGNEPLGALMFYRQALDTKRGSATFGKLRQYNWRMYQSARVSPQTQSYEQAATDHTYSVTPSPATYTAWNEIFNVSNWGVTESTHLEGTSDYHPRLNTYIGNGTLVAFQLSHPPVDSDHLKVWVDGTITTPSAVVTTAANPAFTLGAAPGVAKGIFAFIQTTTNA